MTRFIAAIFSTLTLLFGLAACSLAPMSADADSTFDIGPDAIVLDVRTPEEFAVGHLDGAKLLDFNGGDLAAAIPQLDPNANYFVYCRSGNRSGQAIALMKKAGFSNLTNLGSLEQAAEQTSIRIVK